MSNIKAEKHAVIDWIEGNLKHIAAAEDLYGKPFLLLPWQKAVLRKMYHPDGSIKTRNLFMIGCRKVGKSLFAAAIMLWRFFKTPSGQKSSVSATALEQSSVIFDFCEEMIRLSPELLKHADFKKFKLTNTENGNTVNQLSCGKGVLGPGFSGLNCFDELGIFSETRHWKQLQLIQTSQALSSSYQNLYLANVPEFQTHRSLDILRECERDKDWQVMKFIAPGRYKNPGNEKAWEAANPFLAINAKDPKKFPQVRAEYRRKYKKARESEEAMAEFKRLYLGTGCELSSSNFMNVSDLRYEKKLADIFADETINWTLGLDLSVVNDSTSWSLCGLEECREDIDDPLEDERRRLYVFPRVYYPSLQTKTESYKEKIRQWDHEGFCVLQSESGSTEMKPIVEDIQDFLSDKPVVRDCLEVVFDPSFAASWYEAFEDYPIHKVWQSPKMLTKPIRFLQRKSIQHNLYMLCGKNPCLDFQLESCVVNNRSRNWCGLDRINQKSTNIDAWVATVIATCRLLEIEETGVGDAFVC